jgi:hypothetical protein
MNHRAVRPTLALVVLALVVPPLSAQEKPAAEADLTVHFEPGATVSFRHSMSSRTDFDSMDLHQTIAVTRELTVKGKRVEEGGSVVEVTYDRVAGKLDLGEEMRVEFDSAAGDAPPLEGPNAIVGDSILAFAGRTLTVKLDGTGEVLSVRGYREALKTVIGDAADRIADEAAIADVQELFLRLPGGKCEVGKTWSTSLPVLLTTGRTDWKFDWTLDAVKKGAASISAKGEPGENAGSGRIDITFGPKDGIATSAKLECEMDAFAGIGKATAKVTWEKLERKGK